MVSKNESDLVYKHCSLDKDNCHSSLAQQSVNVLVSNNRYSFALTLMLINNKNKHPQCYVEHL